MRNRKQNETQQALKINYKGNMAIKTYWNQ